MEYTLVKPVFACRHHVPLSQTVFGWLFSWVVFACRGLPPFGGHILMPLNLGCAVHDIFSKVVPDTRTGPRIGLFRLRSGHSTISNQPRVEAGQWDFTDWRHLGNFGFSCKRTRRIGLHMQQYRDTGSPNRAWRSAFMCPDSFAFGHSTRPVDSRLGQKARFGYRDRPRSLLIRPSLSWFVSPVVSISHRFDCLA
jgi:hypothetical protein